MISLSYKFENRLHWYGRTKIRIESKNKYIGWKSDVDAFIWRAWVLTDGMDDKRTTINAPRYTDILIQLHKNIKNRRRGRLTAGVTLLHDNARPHIAALTQSMLTTLKSKFSLIHRTARTLARVITKSSVSWRNFWRANVFVLTPRSQMQSKTVCYKLERTFGNA